VDAAGFIKYLRQQRLVTDYLFVSATVVSIYDYLLTLHLETRLIWFSRWTYTKVLFLLVRYVTLVSVVISLANEAFVNRPQDSCRMSLPVQGWFLMLGVFLSQVVLSIRTWAVWKLNKFVGLGLGALTVAHIVVQCMVLSRYIPSLRYASPPYPGFRGCFITQANGVMWISYTAEAIVETVVLALMVISAIRLYGSGSHGELSYMIHRDGIQLYVYLLAISFANVAIMKGLPFEDTVLSAFMQAVMYPVLTARIVLNIRDVSSRGVPTELHSDFQPPPLVFAAPLHQMTNTAPTGSETIWTHSSSRSQHAHDIDKSFA